MRKRSSSHVSSFTNLKTLRGWGRSRLTHYVISVAIFDTPGYFSSLSFTLWQYFWIPDHFYYKPTQHDRWNVMRKKGQLFGKSGVVSVTVFSQAEKHWTFNVLGILRVVASNYEIKRELMMSLRLDPNRIKLVCVSFGLFLSVSICGQVLARRKEGSGKVKILLHWTPEDMWVKCFPIFYFFANIDKA